MDDILSSAEVGEFIERLMETTTILSAELWNKHWSVEDKIARDFDAMQAARSQANGAANPSGNLCNLAYWLEQLERKSIGANDEQRTI